MAMFDKNLVAIEMNMTKTELFLRKGKNWAEYGHPDE